MGNWTYGAYWVENLRPVSRGPWALCIDWSAPLTGYNVSAATPSLLPCILSEVMKSQQMLGRFCLNISMCGHPRPSEEKEPVIFPLRKKNTQICLQNPDEMKSHDNLKKRVCCEFIVTYFPFSLLI